METSKTYSCQQACEDVCAAILPGIKFSQAEFIIDVRNYLKAHGNYSPFYEQTIMRAFRMVKRNHGIVLVNRKLSEWIKEENRADA